MFNLTPSTNKSGLERLIDTHLEKMSDADLTSEEYQELVAELDTLYKLKEIEKPDRLSRDTIAIVTGNILGIVLIVGYERANVVTSKALSFISKAR